MGISGRIARYFQDSQLTPLLALVAFLAGLFAVAVTPREEEPQINVTMANVFVPFPGASSKDVEALVATPAEQVLTQIAGVEHVYSVLRPGMAVLTVQFEVGVPRIDALVRLYDTINSNRDWVAPELGIGEPIIKPKGIDDVPVVTLTLWSEDRQHGAYELERVAHAAEVELKRVPGTREVQTLGGPGRAVRVLIDADRLAGVRRLGARRAERAPARERRAAERAPRAREPRARGSRPAPISSRPPKCAASSSARSKAGWCTSPTSLRSDVSRPARALRLDGSGPAGATGIAAREDTPP